MLSPTMQREHYRAEEYCQAYRREVGLELMNMIIGIKAELHAKVSRWCTPHPGLG